MSTREVVTPGNRPALFAAQHNQKMAAKQVDFYSPTFPLEHLDVPKCKCFLDSTGATSTSMDL
jgi:chromatin structure-remodeling complex subunit RSC9